MGTESMTNRPRQDPMRGRGTSDNPANRFEGREYETDPEAAGAQAMPATQFIPDASRSVISRNDSPDVPFSASVNPYRGCEHGCVYCYARPTHEYLGYSAGLDFETRILVKEDAPELLRQALMHKRWTPQTLAMSGVTDPYQPVEKEREITRKCLEVLAEFRNPVGIVTKNRLVTRDIDCLTELNQFNAVSVYISVTSLDPQLARILEPRTSLPRQRLETIAALRQADIPVGVLVAPIIPGLTDHETAGVIEAAAEAGAQYAGYVMLRLPHGVKGLFEDWLRAHMPDRASKVLNRIRAMRGGELNETAFGQRMRGSGPYAQQIQAMFDVACRRAGIGGQAPALSTKHFRRPGMGEQLSLFE